VLGPRRIVNLPGISVSVAQMVTALRTVAGDAVAQRIRFQRDESIERIVGSWPGAWDLTRAHALGLVADDSFEAVVRAYIEDDLH
jgi:nucleoside-diphosphate-sugar epimerase